MAYIEPNTDIILLSGVPLDNTYTDTIYFDTAEEQEAHFKTYRKLEFNKQTYQRVNKNSLRIRVSPEFIIDFNYLMFRNTSYGSKWIYAFILETNYINDNVAEVVYEIDVMQTWFFDYTLEPSLVERETSETDEIGDSITPEPVDLGSIVCNDLLFDEQLFTDYVIVVSLASSSSSETTPTGGA